MGELIRRLTLPPGSSGIESLLTHEWLVTNGLGGYASGTVSGVISRGFHGYLISAQPSPLGRTMMLNDLVECLELPGGKVVQLGGEEREGEPLKLHGADFLCEFQLEDGLPVWQYQAAEYLIEKRLVLPHGQNTVYVNFRLLSGEGSVRLVLRPSMQVRPQDSPVDSPLDGPYTLTVSQDRYEVCAGSNLPPLRFLLYGQSAGLNVDRQRIQHVIYRIEQNRGYAARGDLWTPGHFRMDLRQGADATIVASTESWETMSALRPDEAMDMEKDRRHRLLAEAASHLVPGFREKTHLDGPVGELVLAADQFIITPAGRIEDGVRAKAAGNEVRTVIAGYHWFTDWGRDTMISLEGLTLTTGRYEEAAWILRTFAHYVKDGLIPNLFPEGGKAGLYHTADATLWFFHAIDRYVETAGDRSLLRAVLPSLIDIIEHHLKGTLFGIGVDKNDGLLTQGQEGYQLTWMDAKVDDWVVTPRRGKAVEINALWYNALRLMQGWLTEEQQEERAKSVAEHAERARISFNARFWCDECGYLYDVVDGPNGNDSRCRPNQLLAISLHYPILDESRWKPVIEVVEQKLLTPVGLRTLSPDDPDFKPKYDGDLRSRDAAYHQGTVWTWLLGPFVDAWLKLHPGNKTEARAFLTGAVGQLGGEACLGSISEIFDAEPPFAPRGCVAQAWSVAEVLRCWVKTAD
jgi:predicted glycogen debranching enzyme